MDEINSDIGKNLFLSCDWGTSTFRLRLADLNTASLIESIENYDGIKNVYIEWSKSKKNKNRLDYFLEYVKKNIQELESKTDRDLKGVPIIISGMASSNIGLKELPYASLPQNLESLKLNLFIIEARPEFPHRIKLISGIKTKSDVIRGEETQAVAIALSYKVGDATIILPGTHSKHVIVQNNQIVDFKTYFTGELFELLSTQSILKDSLSNRSAFFNDVFFKKGVNASIEENILHSIFKIRATDLLDKVKKSDNTSFLSGLLIGQEVKELKDLNIDHLFLAGEGKLQKYYKAALQELNLLKKTTIISGSEAENLVVKGHSHLMKQI